ncbi:tripeptidyl peptidase A [Vararia minispora EC-137]|uniref:Tripeptidyl peptidase A n=1 Tax=Vararia minispora EC-137 TaxID=1314806 RepID=A0ACB8QQH4_9AGAM|nr:tripeptidyl peptidase A [Vararia minispora EC-137]
MFTLALLVASIVVVVSPLPSASVYKLKERIPNPRDWVQLHRAPVDYILPLRIALPQIKFGELERHLYEVSNPGHQRYGAHLSKEEVERLIAPHPESLAVINKWLTSHGLDEKDLQRSPAQDWVTIHVPIGLAEEMLDTKFHTWKHVVHGDVVVGTTSYSLPEDVHAHVELVQPTTYFARPRALRTTLRFTEDTASAAVNKDTSAGRITIPGSEVSVDASCNTTITVACLKELYNAVGFGASSHNGNILGITGYLEQFANFEDLQLFYADQVPAAVNTSFTVSLINGGGNNQSSTEAGAEADLDVQFGLGLTFPTPGIFWSTGGRPPFTPDAITTGDTNEPYLDWLSFVLRQDNVPQTISTSYADDEQTVPESYARRVCAEFAQLGARGSTLLFGSGDGGVGDGNPDPATQNCFANDGTNRTRFIPLFPASCPFITSVGGTVNIPEVAVSFSGGGFSNYFQRPSYQEVAISEYLDSLPDGTYEGLFNRSGRGIPDVAAQADRFRIFLSGRPVSIGGTSAATPTFAGIISLLNSARLSKGLPSLGFINPLLYSDHANTTFNDITVGNNPGCGTKGFNATAGWDPVTGFGTPNFGKLLRIVAP